MSEILVEKTKIMAAIADKIRDDAELLEAGEERRLPMIVKRLTGLKKYINEIQKDAKAVILPSQVHDVK